MRGLQALLIQTKFRRKRFWLAPLLIASLNPAAATDWYTGAPVAEDRANWLVDVDASIAVAPRSAFANAAATVSLGGVLQESGPRARAEAMIGQYNYTSGSGAKIKANQAEGAALAGYEWLGPTTKAALFVGLSLRTTDLSDLDPTNRVSGVSVGLKAALDLYMRPTSQTMVSAYGGLTTNDKAYFTRLQAGYRVFEDIYLGPEIALLGNNFFRQWRIGGHLTGLQMGALQASLSAGYQFDRDRKSGAYSSLDFRTKF